MSELLAPAGSFDSGFYALHSGADALYLGLSSFSARKAAKNFTYDEFSRIKALAETQGKKVYAALNTVIRDDELEAVTGLLFDLAALNVDGIIVQDFGLLAILTRFFPSIAPHASTQMAVHNAQGAQALLRAGARRLILARELTLEEITTIRRRVPEAELEVFIHGALCYSFSGLCLASGLLLRRSGNRGECAQLCRSCYKDSSGDAGYFFSRPDLAAEERVLRLRDMGIALKIEGRMKPPAWVAAVTAYYRALLDGKPRAELEELLEKSRLIFSRASGPGFLDGSGGGQTSPLYPGHTGIFAGRTAEESRNSEFGRTPAFFRLREKTHGRALRGSGTAASRQYTLRVPSNPLRVGEQQFCSRKIATSPLRGPGPHRGTANTAEALPPAQTRPSGFFLHLETSLALRDGLMYFSPNPSGGPPEAHPFSVTELYTKGKKSHFAQKGELVFVGGPELPPGTEIRKISSHSSRLPEKGGNFPKKKLPLAIHLRLSPNSLEVSLTSPEEIFPAFSQIFPLSPQSAKTRRLFCEIVEPYLAPPGESEYEKSGFSWENTSGLPDDGLYINPKALKALRRELYAALDEHRASSRRKKTEKILTFFTPKTPGVETHAPPPPRGRIHGEDTGLPFVMAPQNVNPSSPEGLEGLYRDKEGRVYLPLAPVLLADAEAYLEEIQTLVRTALAQEESLLINVGLCNASHFGLTETFAEEKRVSFFLDYGLYCANRAAAAFFRGAFPRLEFFYPWIEGPEALPREAAGLPAADYKDFQPPLFIARASPEKTTENRKTPARAQQGALYRQGKRTFILKKTRAAKTPLDILFPAPE